MPVFKTRWGMAVQRVLNHYPPGSSLLMALEQVVITAINSSKEESRDVIAQATCQGYHDGPAQGLVCKACFDVAEGKRVPATDPDDMPADTALEAKQREDVAKSVANLISGVEGPELPPRAEGPEFEN